MCRRIHYIYSAPEAHIFLIALHININVQCCYKRTGTRIAKKPPCKYKFKMREFSIVHMTAIHINALKV